MIMNVPSPISDIKRERRALRKREMILNQQIKNDKAILRNQTDPNICTRMQVGITTNEEERHQNHTRLAEIAEELSQLEDAEAGEDGTLSVSALLQLKSYGINDEMTIYSFSSRYKSDRKNYPEKKFPPLKDLAHVEAVLAAWAATDDNTVWLTDETWDNFLDRFRSMKTLKSVKDGFQKHYETMYVGSDVWLSRTTSALMNFAATKAKATDVPAAVTYMNAPVVIAYCQYVLGATEGEHDPYVDFEKKYWEAEAASNQGKSPYFVHVVCASGDEPGAKEPQTAYWFGGVPPADALAVWNAAIAKTVPSWAALSGHVRLGAAPFGCVKEPGLPFNTGHDVLMQAVASALRFIKYFVLNPQLTDTSKDDQISHFAFKQVLVWLGGLGFDALRLAFRALAEAEIEGADYYVSLTDDELTKVLLSIASENSSPSSGFGVLRPDFSDYVSCVVETGLVPRWLGAVLLLTLFKYASIEIDHTGDRALIHID